MGISSYAWPPRALLLTKLRLLWLSAIVGMSVASAAFGQLPGGADAPVDALAVQLDGKVLLSGELNKLYGQTRPGLGRINVDLSLDVGFSPPAFAWPIFVLPLEDGRIIVGGSFSKYQDNQVWENLMRLNPDGSPDTTFEQDADRWVWALAAQPDAKVIVGGDFTKLGAQNRTRVARLKADGTLDSFAPVVGGIGAFGVFALAVQPDGRILLGGDFKSLWGQSRGRGQTVETPRLGA